MRKHTPAHPFSPCTRAALLLLVVGSLLSPAPLLASDTTMTWSFDALLRETERTYPALAARARAKDAAEAELEAARWQRYPVPGIQAGTDNDGNRETVAFVQQPLWTGGRITAGIDAAEARLGAADEDIGIKRREVLSRLIDAYVETRRRQAQQHIYRKNIQQHERLLAMIERRVSNEVSPKVDHDLARSRLYQAANELSFALQALADAQTQLGELVGQNVMSVDQTAPEETRGLPESKAEALTQAISASPRLQRLSYELLAADADVKSERASYWPQVSLRLEHRHNSAQLPANQRENRALLQLESQFGAGLSSGARVNAAQARRDALSEERRTAQREIESEVALSWNQWTASRLRLENSRINRDSAQLVFDSYTRQYVVGQKSWLDVLNAVREATTASVTVEDATAEALRARLKLRMLSGGL